MKALAVIPTAFVAPQLEATISRLTYEGVDVLTVCNRASERRTIRQSEADLHLDRPGWGIYRTWNFGMRLGAQAGVPVLILNDDIILASGAARAMVTALTDDNDRWAVLGFDYSPVPTRGGAVFARHTRGSYRHGGVGGFAFGVHPRRCARVDRRFMWWGGDDDLMFATAAAGGRVGILCGAKVDHPQPSHTATKHPEWLPEGWAANDRALLLEKWNDPW